MNPKHGHAGGRAFCLTTVFALAVLGPSGPAQATEVLHIYPSGFPTSAEVNDITNLQDALDCAVVAPCPDIIHVHGTLNFGDDSQGNPRGWVDIDRSVTITGDTQLDMDYPFHDDIGVPTEATPGIYSLISGGGNRRELRPPCGSEPNEPCPFGAVFNMIPEPSPGPPIEVTIENLWFDGWAGDAIYAEGGTQLTVRGCRFTEPVFDNDYSAVPGGYHYHAVDSPAPLVAYSNYIDMYPRDGQFNLAPPDHPWGIPTGSIEDDTFCIAVVETPNAEIHHNNVRNATRFQVLGYIGSENIQIYRNLVATGANSFAGADWQNCGLSIGWDACPDCPPNNYKLYENRIVAEEGFVGIRVWGGRGSDIFNNEIHVEGGLGGIILKQDTDIHESYYWSENELVDYSVFGNIVTGSGEIGLWAGGVGNEFENNDLSAFNAARAQVFVEDIDGGNALYDNRFGNIVGSIPEGGLACYGDDNAFEHNTWMVNFPAWPSGSGLWLMAEGAEGNTVMVDNTDVTGGVKPDKHWMDRNAEPTNELWVDGMLVRP